MFANDLSYIGFYKSTNAGLNWTAEAPQFRQTIRDGTITDPTAWKPDNSNSILMGTLNIEKNPLTGNKLHQLNRTGQHGTQEQPPGQPGPSNFVHADVHEIVCKSQRRK